MNHDRATEEGQELAALYALGALSQQEARAFDAHLNEGCEICAAELAQFDKVVGVLGADALPADPAAYLGDLLTVRIEKEASATPGTSSVIRFTEKQTPVQRTQAAPPSGLGHTFLPWAVAAVLLIALAYTFASWRTERQSLRATLDRERGLASETASQTANIKEELAKHTALSEELAQINSVLSSPQWRIIQLTAQAPESSARVYWDVQGNRWVVSTDLPPPPPGKTYQLWFVTPTAKISAGLISTDKRGHGFSVVQLPPSAAQVAAAAITLEPEGGSQQPTMPIYALGNAS